MLNIIVFRLLDPVLKDTTPTLLALARREKQREVVFQHGGLGGQQAQLNRISPREFLLKQTQGAARDYFITLVVVVDYSIYMR